MTELEVWMMYFEDGGRSQEPMNAGETEKIQEPDFPPNVSRRIVLL